MVCKVADLGLARKLNDQGVFKREKKVRLDCVAEASSKPCQILKVERFLNTVND